MKLIAFTINLHMETPAVFQNRPLDDFIHDIDDPDTYCDDKESLLLETQRNSSPKYRMKDFKWENLHHDLPQLFTTSPKEKYHYVKEPLSGELVIKTTADGRQVQKGYDTHRKTCQALEYGCSLARGKFPEGYAREMDKFKESLKKEKMAAKSKGETEERDADPISFELFTFLCTCATNVGDALFWCMAVLQWNCIARCQNIDDLTVRNFTSQSNEDNIQVTFDKTKMDKLGEKLVLNTCMQIHMNGEYVYTLHLQCTFVA